MKFDNLNFSNVGNLIARMLGIAKRGEKLCELTTAEMMERQLLKSRGEAITKEQARASAMFREWQLDSEKWWFQIKRAHNIMENGVEVDDETGAIYKIKEGSPE